jgi:integrase
LWLDSGRNEDFMAVTFAVQSKLFLDAAVSRKRNPVKTSTLVTWKGALNKWIVPHFAEAPLATVANPSVRELVEKMYKAGLSAQTINSYVGLVKLVVASALNDLGEPEYPRVWNSNFLDLPVIKNQRQPCFTGEAVSSIVRAAKGQSKVLYTLLAGTGLRVGEALALEVKHVRSDCRTIGVEQSVFWGEIQTPKTHNAYRKVDLAPELAALLKAHLQTLQGGLIFKSAQSTPLHLSNLLRREFHPLLKRLGIEKQGFHGFRRFRATWLRRQQTPEDVLRYWLGHSSGSITDRYSKLKDDENFRQMLSQQVGLGFEVSR